MPSDATAAGLGEVTGVATGAALSATRDAPTATTAIGRATATTLRQPPQRHAMSGAPGAGKPTDAATETAIAAVTRSASVPAPEALRRPLRIGLSGAPGVGKTTLARALGDALGIPVIPEEMRAHLERTGQPLTGLPPGDAAQILHQLWRERAACEDATPSFVADNSCLDFAAYAVFYDCLAEPAPGDPDEPVLLREPRARLAAYDAIIVLPCGVLPYVRDGVRPASRSAQLRHHLIIDGMLRRWADPRKVHHLPDACVTLPDRVAWVRALIAPPVQRGTVYLVGAGPGDPGLLTVRARELLAAADVVAYDALVAPAILAQVRPGAELVPVGRRHGSGPTSYRLHPSVIPRAAAGLSVVRLKAGDPLIFGRGGEEAEELRDAGIAFEIVPGVSSALGAAAYAGIPLTHRDHASDVTFVSGHDLAGDRRSLTDWTSLAHQTGTLVLFMAARTLATNLARLIAAGRSPGTPAAYVAAATTPQQQVITGTLETLPALAAAAADPAAPALVIIGDVVGLRDRLAWFAPGPAGTPDPAESPPAVRAQDLASSRSGSGRVDVDVDSNVSVDGDVDAKSLVELAPRPSVPTPPALDQAPVSPDVNEGVSLDATVNLNDARQGQGQLPRHDDDSNNRSATSRDSAESSPVVRTQELASSRRSARRVDVGVDLDADVSVGVGSLVDLAPRSSVHTPLVPDQTPVTPVVNEGVSLHLNDASQRLPRDGASGLGSTPVTSGATASSEAPAKPAPRGLLVVYTGQGKGKTTAALGIVFRALGRGMRVAVVQFIKGKWKTGERLFAETLPGLTFLVMGKGFTWNSDDLGQDRVAALAAWAKTKELIASGEHEIVVVDEITYAINYGFIELDDVLDALRARPPHVHVVATGRNAPEGLCTLADLVTDMAAVKHPFALGIRAQLGIDY